MHIEFNKSIFFKNIYIYLFHQSYFRLVYDVHALVMQSSGSDSKAGEAFKG